VPTQSYYLIRDSQPEAATASQTNQVAMAVYQVIMHYAKRGASGVDSRNVTASALRQDHPHHQPVNLLVAGVVYLALCVSVAALTAADHRRRQVFRRGLEVITH
jgi:hypothetical protein